MCYRNLLVFGFTLWQQTARIEAIRWPQRAAAIGPSEGLSSQAQCGIDRLPQVGQLKWLP
jgi:hypothetical protein